MPQKSYLLSPSLLSDVRETISRVNAMPLSTPASPRKQEHAGQISTPQLIRIGTATGSWNKAATNTVSWNPGSGVTATSTATNLFANITGTTAAYSVAIARVANDWYLIAAECT